MPTEKGEILEVTVPRYSAHCSHDVGSLPHLLTHKLLSEIGKKVEGLVRQGRLSDISLHLPRNDWIKNELIPDYIENGILTHWPHEHDWQYFPTSIDLSVMTCTGGHPF